MAVLVSLPTDPLASTKLAQELLRLGQLIKISHCLCHRVVINSSNELPICSSPLPLTDIVRWRSPVSGPVLAGPHPPIALNGEKTAFDDRGEFCL